MTSSMLHLSRCRYINDRADTHILLTFHRVLACTPTSSLLLLSDFGLVFTSGLADGVGRLSGGSSPSRPPILLFLLSVSCESSAADLDCIADLAKSGTKGTKVIWELSPQQY